MESIIKVPRDIRADYDYIAFSFDGKHSYEDFNIYRVSDGNDGYSESLVSAISDKSIEIPGMDGQYFFGTQHKNRIFNIKFAFDSLSEEKLQEMKSWLSGKKVCDLWFDEAPHKVYGAKVTSAATITATPFSDSVQGRIYKGTGTVEFTSYHPYAHTPRWIDYRGSLLDGKQEASYQYFNNFESIRDALPGHRESGNVVEGGYGDLPFPFVANLIGLANNETSKSYTVFAANGKENTLTIKIPNGEAKYYQDYRWDSKLGEVSAFDKRLNARKLLPYEGNADCVLEPGQPQTTNINSLEYDYWYY